MYDVILDYPDIYFKAGEEKEYYSVLTSAGFGVEVNLFREHTHSNACFDNILTLLPSASEMFFNAIAYPAMYEAIKYVIISMAKYVTKKIGRNKTSDRMPHIQMITGMCVVLLKHLKSMEMKWRIERMMMMMLAANRQSSNENINNEEKLELYRLIGEGYKAMHDGRESSLEEVVERLQIRRNERG